MVGAAFSMGVLTHSLSVVMGCFLKRELPFGVVDHKQKGAVWRGDQLLPSFSFCNKDSSSTVSIVEASQCFVFIYLR